MKFVAPSKDAIEAWVAWFNLWPFRALWGPGGVAVLDTRAGEWLSIEEWVRVRREGRAK